LVLEDIYLEIGNWNLQMLLVVLMTVFTRLLG